jgi:hypothetical protein
VFCMVVLQWGDATIRSSKVIRNRLTWGVDDWDMSEVETLVQNNVCDMDAKLNSRQDGQSLERRVKIFREKMLKGDVQGAVKCLNENEKGGVLLTDGIDEKTGLSVKQVLLPKYPDTTASPLYSLHPYDGMPGFSSVDVTHETIEQVARNLSGSSSLGGVHSHALSHWLLEFDNASETICHALANFINWMDKSLPPWTVYRVMWTGRLLALDKMSGVRTIYIGDLMMHHCQSSHNSSRQWIYDDLQDQQPVWRVRRWYQ